MGGRYVPNGRETTCFILHWVCSAFQYPLLVIKKLNINSFPHEKQFAQLHIKLSCRVLKEYLDTCTFSYYAYTVPIHISRSLSLGLACDDPTIFDLGRITCRILYSDIVTCNVGTYLNVSGISVTNELTITYL